MMSVHYPSIEEGHHREAAAEHKQSGLSEVNENLRQGTSGVSEGREEHSGCSGGGDTPRHGHGQSNQAT
jgi:hypothetical protein